MERVGIIKLIVNADDFGYSKGINLGIIEGFENGILTSTTLMTNMPGAEHAFSLMDKYKNLLNVGIHLVLGAGSPVSQNVYSLIDNNGNFHKMNTLLELAMISDIEKEFNSQMEKFLSFGYKPTHIDCHQHSHKNKDILDIVLKIAHKYSLPLRMFDKGELLKGKYAHIKTIDYFVGEFYGEDISIELIKSLIEESLNHNTVELMCHPGYVDQILLDNSSYNTKRAKELSILISKEIKEFIIKNNIELINYKNI